MPRAHPAPHVAPARKRQVAALMAQLSEQECLVLRLVLLGWSNKEVGGELRVSDAAVAGHLTRIRRKYAANGLSLVRRLVERGVVK